MAVTVTVRAMKLLLKMLPFIPKTLFQFVQAAITKYHKVGDFINNRYLFLMLLKARKSKIKADSVPGEGMLLVQRWFLLAVSSHDGMGQLALQGLLYRGTNLVHEDSTHDLVTSTKPASERGGGSTCKLGAGIETFRPQQTQSPKHFHTYYLSYLTWAKAEIVAFIYFVSTNTSVHGICLWG